LIKRNRCPQFEVFKWKEAPKLGAILKKNSVWDAVKSIFLILPGRNIALKTVKKRIQKNIVGYRINYSGKGTPDITLNTTRLITVALGQGKPLYSGKDAMPAGHKHRLWLHRD
jgi:hypothetical protein